MRTVDELKNEYPEKFWREKYVAVCDLIEVLSDCIISDSYAVSDALNEAIKLTPSGTSVADRLARKSNVPPKEARLMCALNLGYKDLFIDIDKIDVVSLEQAIHREIVDNRIIFPFIYGRDLYDSYAEEHEGEKDSLSTKESLKLLNKTPKGVFQYGSYTVGPFGLRKSSISRSLQAPRSIPAYHCSKTTCHLLHEVLFQTSPVAVINRDREKLDKLLRDSGSSPSEWWEFAHDVSGFSGSYYSDGGTATLIPLLGDCLSLRELRLLVSYLLDASGGSLRASISSFSAVTNSEEFTVQHDRAELLQLCLFVRGAELRDALDTLVNQGEIHVPVGDVRRPITNSRLRAGAFGLQAELGHFGVRFISSDRGLPLLRERKLLDKLYNKAYENDLDELEWQLRDVNGATLAERLEEFYRLSPPAEVIRRLILARRSNLELACAEVGIKNTGDMADEEIVGQVLWKLGFPVDTGDDPHEEFWRTHEGLRALLGHSSDVGRSSRFIEVAGSYFRSLEGVLVDSLAFTTWALLNDHTNAPSPFSYSDQDDRKYGLRMLDDMSSPSSEVERLEMYSEGKASLIQLISAFEVLAKHLKSLRGREQEFKREEALLPDFEGKTELKKFPFYSTVPFLNLSSSSQVRILEGLTFVSSELRAGEVSVVRNECAHYRPDPPSVDRVEVALNATQRAVNRLEMLGFARLVFQPAAVSVDRWGQSLHTFVGPRSYQHEFARPTRLDWARLPPLGAPQYLFRSANFGEATEVLRFVRRYESDFSMMWGSYPSRRRSVAGAGAAESGPSHQSATPSM